MAGQGACSPISQAVALQNSPVIATIVKITAGTPWTHLQAADMKPKNQIWTLSALSGTPARALAQLYSRIDMKFE